MDIYIPDIWDQREEELLIINYTGDCGMKAIQIKYLGPTIRGGSRLKAGIMIESLDYELNIEDQARKLADRYCMEKGWGKISGFGTLPNGDWVGVL